MFGLWIPPKDFDQFAFHHYAILHGMGLFDRYMVNYYNWWTYQLQYQQWSGILMELTGCLPSVKLWLQIGEEEILQPGSLINSNFDSCAQYAPWHALAGLVMWDECSWNIGYRMHNCEAHGHRQYTFADYQAACQRIRSTFPAVALMDVEPIDVIASIYPQYAPEVHWFGGDNYGSDSDSYSAQYTLQFLNAQTIMQSHGMATPFIALKYGNGRSKDNVLGGIRGAIAGGIPQDNIYFWADPLENITAFTDPPSTGWTALKSAIEEWKVNPLPASPNPPEGTGIGNGGSHIYNGPGITWKP
jgi:hypothetical protein